MLGPLMATSPVNAAQRAARVWAPLLAVSAIAWLAVLGAADAEVGVMGSAAAYVAGWVAMTAAMMLPPLAWFGSVYIRGVHRESHPLAATGRVLALAAGYLLVWFSTALAALLLAWGFDHAAETRPGAVPWVGGAVLVTAGAYQLSSLKLRCLTRCRSPLSFALSASRHTGPLRDFEVGVEHGAWCVACCWALMAVLVAVGTMSILWMALIAAVILLERSWSEGERLARAVGVALIVVGVLAPVVERLVPTLHNAGMEM